MHFEQKNVVQGVEDRRVDGNPGFGEMNISAHANIFKTITPFEYKKMDITQN